VVAADDVTEVDRLAEYQARPIGPQQGPGGPPGPDAGPPAPVMASRDSTSQFNPKVSMLSRAVAVPVWICPSAAGIFHYESLCQVMQQRLHCVSRTQHAQDDGRSCPSVPCYPASRNPSHAPCTVCLSMQEGAGAAAAAADSGSDQAAAAAAGTEAGSSSSEGVDPEELKRREVLARLQGRESQLESGLKVGLLLCCLVCCCCCPC
jgi:hypothetical protein